MSVSPKERKFRAVLPLIRLMQSWVPWPLARFFLKQSLKKVRLGPDVHRESVSADGVPCEWILPAKSREGRVLLYLHGGGFVYGLTPQHLQMGAELARKTGARILLVDYRLAPRHPFPAPLEDCETAYRWLLEQGILPREIAVAGDSAGGNLTLTLMLKLRELGTELPAAGACLSPAVDFSNKINPPHDFQDPVVPPRIMKRYTEAYLGASDPLNPLISPVFADLAGLPPLLVHVGEDETLREDALRITARAEAAGVDIRLEIYARMWHVWQLFPWLPQAEQSLEEIANFLLEQWGSTSK